MSSKEALAVFLTGLLPSRQVLSLMSMCFWWQVGSSLPGLCQVLHEALPCLKGCPSSQCTFLLLSPLEQGGTV